MKRLLLILPFLILQYSLLISQNEATPRVYETQRISSDKPKVDGKLDDAIWTKATWQGDFTAFEPDNGIPPKNKTEFALVYDNQHLYFAFRCFHTDLSKIESRLSRRDDFAGDWVEVNIDSYNDNNTAFSFNTSVAEVRGDEFVSNNGNDWDANWNPIWYTATEMTDYGWSAEMKIPLSQLRFSADEVQSWGLNVVRRDFAHDERSLWQHIPQNQTGWISNAGTLTGLRGIKPKRQVEIQPYTVLSHTTYEGEEGNPYADGSDTKMTVGVDGKIGVTSDLTLDFTINPDFGQVEADPSQLNIDGFQIFFDERRPFFVENANLFSYQVARLEWGGGFNNDNLFYSRRIGASPSGGINAPNGAYVSRPSFTSILGSAKISGKTKKGLSVGLLESITAEEHAQISLNNVESTQVVEPLTNYAVGRLSQDINEGKSQIGLSMTSVNRQLSEDYLVDQYHRSAYSGGVNFFHTWKEREWQINGNVIYSRVNGSANKITNTQQSFERYYQRPDADHLDVDDTRTSLSGHGGTFALANYGGSDNISFQTGVTWRSPGLELNDIGFLNLADEINQSTWVGYRIPQPFGIFRSARINVNQFMKWTYGGEHLAAGWNTNWHANFKNFWNLGTGITYNSKSISAKRLFGGPKLREYKAINQFLYFNSDSRKPVRFGGNLWTYYSIGSDKEAVNNYGIGFWVGAQPSSALSININPFFSYNDRQIQNVGTYNMEGQTRYLAGHLERHTFSLSARVNYSLTPNMTIQFWGQPFITRGRYDDFKYITDPMASLFENRFERYSDGQIAHNTETNEYIIDEEASALPDHTFYNPDFNFLQFRSNLVFRWEYKPGSEFYAVWTQGNTMSGDPSKGLYDSLSDDLFGEQARNTFLIKMTYRFY